MDLGQCLDITMLQSYYTDLLLFQLQLEQCRYGLNLMTVTAVNTMQLLTLFAINYQLNCNVKEPGLLP